MKNSELRDYSKRYFQAERDILAKSATSPKEIIDFYGKMAQERQHDSSFVDVSLFSKKMDIAVVSAIRTYANMGPFRPVEWASFVGVRLLDILIRQDQVVAGSTIALEDSGINLYSPWGVILAGGKIVSSYPYDGVTQVKDGMVSSKFDPRLGGLRPSERLDMAISSRRIRNELDIVGPKIAGIFHCTNNDFPAEPGPRTKVCGLITKFGIPVYELDRGRFYMAHYEDGGKLIRDSEKGTRPSEIIQREFALDAGQREDVVNFMLKNLVLDPRNSITAGYDRGKYLSEKKAGLGKVGGEVAEFITQVENPSLRVYGEMVLGSFKEHSGEEAGSTYLNRKNRIGKTGHLGLERSDLEYYIATGSLPDYLKDH